MKRIILLAAAIGLTGALSAPAHADPVPRTVVWHCVLEDGTPVDFVVAAETARHGIEQADSRAGTVFEDQFGESCEVQ